MVVRRSAKTSVRFNLVKRVYVRKQCETGLRRFFGSDPQEESSSGLAVRINPLAVQVGYL